MKTERQSNIQDRIRGCLVGGAAGDALGFPVEFMSRRSIVAKYGNNGIASYACNARTNTALISDDTQMTLFTAAGLIQGNRQDCRQGITAPLETYVHSSYLDWYRMQRGLSQKGNSQASRLCDVPEMGEHRAPGITCMSALGRGRAGSIENPLNTSKGCGGVMRAAPVGLCLNVEPQENDRIDEVDMLAAKVAALTHGHELGYMSASVLAHVVNRAVYGGQSGCMPLRDIMLEAVAAIRKLFADSEYGETLCELLELAMGLTENADDDATNIARLGEGWIGDEAIAIALYCSLKYENDFSKALCAAVNHDGDSDSTGAITGNILGAVWGYDRLPSLWKDRLECSDIILEIADELYGLQNE